MNFIQLIWACAILVPFMFKPSPITYFGTSRVGAPLMFHIGPADTRTIAPSDSAWAAQSDSMKCVIDPLYCPNRADSLRLGLADPFSFTSYEFHEQYLRARMKALYRSRMERFAGKQNLQI